MDVRAAPVALAFSAHGPDRIVSLTPGMAAAEAFARMVGRAVSEIQATLDAAAAMDAEAIHDARIGLRRLRAPLALYAPCLGAAAGAFDARLRRSGHVFGAAREWHVLLTEALPRARAAGIDGARIAVLADAIHAPRAAAEAGIGRELREHLAVLLPAVSAWAAAGARAPALLGDAVRLARPVDAVTPALMARLSRRVANAAKGHKHAETEALHRLRKRTKTLRYAAEALAPLYGEKSVRPLARRCKALQGVLGHVNDAAAIPDLLSRLGAPAGSELAAAVHDLCAWAQSGGAEARRHVGRRWHELRGTKPFWT